MSNYNVKLDLLKLNGAFVTNLKGKTETKRCLVIPVEDSGLYVGEKGVYLNASAYELRERRYDQTHLVKAELSREKYQSLSEEERKQLPILGSLSERETQTRTMEVKSAIDAATAIADDGEDFPF